MSESKKKDYSFLWKNEDYWAIWLGSILLIFAIIIFLGNPPENMHERINVSNTTMEYEVERFAAAPEGTEFFTIAWYDAHDELGRIQGRNTDVAQIFMQRLGRVFRWETNPLDSFVRTAEWSETRNAANYERWRDAEAARDEARANAETAEAAAAAVGFTDASLNAEAIAAISEWRSARNAESSARSAATTTPQNRFVDYAILMVFIGLLFALGMGIMGHSIKAFLTAFPMVFVLATLSFVFAAQQQANAWGLEYVMWALFIGLLIANTIGTPKFVMPAVQTEFYIKTGLVMLGSTILMNQILLIGLPGIFLTWGVTPVVLVFSYWLGQKVLRIESKSLNITISADQSVSGVSAAIAAAAASRAKKEELTLAVGMSITFTAFMMIAMPAVLIAVNMHPVMAGSWIGSTIDSTGAVVAAGELIGPAARDVAATIKMIQNIIIGAMAFCIAAYWCLIVDSSRKDEVNLTFGAALKEIWVRFPKFVLGFIGASIVFSILHASLGRDVAGALIDDGVVRLTGELQRWFFALAFTSIGLSTNFRELWVYLKGGKAVALYLGGQFFNVVLSFSVGYVLFFVLFPWVTESLMLMAR